jgi:hypothetical protein
VAFFFAPFFFARKKERSGEAITSTIKQAIPIEITTKALPILVLGAYKLFLSDNNDC